MAAITSSIATAHNLRCRILSKVTVGRTRLAALTTTATSRADDPPTTKASLYPVKPPYSSADTPSPSHPDTNPSSPPRHSSAAAHTDTETQQTEPHNGRLPAAAGAPEHQGRAHTNHIQAQSGHRSKGDLAQDRPHPHPPPGTATTTTTTTTDAAPTNATDTSTETTLATTATVPASSPTPSPPAYPRPPPARPVAADPHPQPVKEKSKFELTLLLLRFCFDLISRRNH